MKFEKIKKRFEEIQKDKDSLSALTDEKEIEKESIKI